MTDLTTPPLAPNRASGQARAETGLLASGLAIAAAALLYLLCPAVLP